MDLSILPALTPCSYGPCTKNTICKDFNGTYVCDCKGGYYFSAVGCIGKDIFLIIFI